MKISDLLDSECVLPDLSADSKSEAINKLIDTLSSKLDDLSIASIRQAVMDRESIMSTGVGKGLAIPHGKSSKLNETYAAFGKLRKPVEFDSIDGQSVQLLFLLVGPQSQNSVHIKLLSRISRLLNSNTFRDKLLAGNETEEIIQLFRTEEEHYARI